MTDMELLTTALAIGAACGVTGVSGSVVPDLHAALRAAVHRRLNGDGYGARVLDAYESDPDLWRTRLLRVLAHEVEMDEEIRVAARAVLRAHRPTGCITQLGRPVGGVRD
ncbi:hypothetical protein AB0D35_14680 [Streptomyces sp. NPDC048301]|uniref:hypothetical protein n=1 Tax=unclassified Streptomyces TaxID=2593676 RepID=UPI00343CA667